MTLLLVVSPALSQITIDGSLGGEPGSVVAPGGSFTYDITEDYGRVSGSNLFHSFELFSVLRGESANFSSNTGGITNVLARVTGGKSSLIEGRVSSSIGGADFWFINPAGIVVGKRAVLDFSGAIHLSTANHIESSEGGQFSATSPADIGSLQFTPSAFGFVGSSSATLSLDDADLELADGQKLLLAGSEVNIVKSDIEAPDGVIAVVGAGSGSISISVGDAVADTTAASGIVELLDSDLDVSGSAGGSVLVSGGTVTIAGSDLVSDADEDSVPGMPQGRISVLGNTIDVNDGSDIESIARGANKTAEISLRANSSLTISDQFTSVVSLPFQFGSTGGDIHLAAPRIVIENQAEVAGNARRDARGGDLMVTAEELLVRNNADLKLDTSSTARGGTLFIDASTVVVEGRANVTTDAFGESRGGQLVVNADTLEISNGEITAQTTDGSGAGIVLNIADTLTISNNGAIATESFGAGPGADVTVNARAVFLDQGGQIDSSALNSGRGGNIVLQVAETLTLTGGSVARQSEISAQSGDLDRESFLGDVPGYGSGEGGSILLAANHISVTDGARITSQGRRDGNAGTVSLSSTRLDVDNAGIETSAPAAAGGNIDIRVRDFIGVVDGRVTASAGGVTPGDDGGNIFIDPELLFFDRATISANANAGNGGNITIVANSILKSPDTVIEASSRQGIDGDITIDGVVNEVTALETLSVEFANVVDLLSRRCTVAQLADRSSFVVQPPRRSERVQPSGFQMAPLAYNFNLDAEPGLSWSSLYGIAQPGGYEAFSSWGQLGCAP